MKFQKAERKKSKLRLALTGPSGSGKTRGALMIAKGIGGKTAVIDTEKGSASLYSDLMDFDVLELDPPYAPARFIQAIQSAESAGFQTLIIDSVTHEWNGKGGCLELVDEIARAKYRGNSWSAWNEVTPRHREFIDSLLRSPLHIIVTMRSKTETAQTEENGRKKIVKLGMKAEQRDGVEYEFTTVLDLIHDGYYAVASKDRTGLFSGKDAKKITEDTGKELLAWLDSGVLILPTYPEKDLTDTYNSAEDAIQTKNGISKNFIADVLLSIKEAPSLDELKKVYFSAYKVVTEANEVALACKLESAKDKRKFELEKLMKDVGKNEATHS